MDEVDRIIFQSLRQIGCEIDSEYQNLDSFTSELFVRAVSMCLKEIRQSAAALPLLLPANMAQRFAVATALAEACTACGYRSDIGYQTFLYPNTLEVRRLFMFLIEKLSKYNRLGAETTTESGVPENASQRLKRDIKDSIMRQLNQPWLPAYCRRRQSANCSAEFMAFLPQLNLSIPEISHTGHQVPSIFQQTAAPQYDLISSVLHRNACDFYSSASDKCLRKLLATSTETGAISLVASANATEQPLSSTLGCPLKQLNERVAALKSAHDNALAERQTASDALSAVKAQHLTLQETLEPLQKAAKLQQRTSVVLQNAGENILKLRALITTTQERRKTLEQQWQDYRQPLAENLQRLQAARQTKQQQSALELQATIGRLEVQLRDKRTEHAQLARELKAALNGAQAGITRKEYTHRLHEFSGNIRKQRNDIYKVLDDTRDLQKQLNSVDAQLRRQFNYTDDLLFQSAKRDAHAKRAYKLLIALHASCSKLVELTTLTGNVSKQSRELEVQIDRERIKNVALSLQQISHDVRNIETVIKNIQAEIYKEENKITAA